MYFGPFIRIISTLLEASARGPTLWSFARCSPHLADCLCCEVKDVRPFFSTKVVGVWKVEGMHPYGIRVSGWASDGNCLVSWFISPIYGMYPTSLYRCEIIHFTKYQQDIPVVFQIPPYVFGVQIPPRKTVWKSRELGVAPSQDSSDHRDHYMFNQGYQKKNWIQKNLFMRGIKQHMYGAFP